MKSFNIILLLLHILPCSYSQSGLAVFLQDVERNNQELLAAQNLRDATKLEARTNINPDNPFIEYGYLPGSNEQLGTKTLYSVSQSFQFPTVYSTKRKLAAKQGDVIEEGYKTVRKGVLIKAKLLYYEYVFLTKQVDEFAYRVENAQKVYSSYKEKLELGSASVLELNKAKILYISLKSKHQLAKQEIRNIEKELLLINGNKELLFLEASYQAEYLQPLDSIINDLILLSPEIASSREAVLASELETSISKQNWFPQFQIGYEAETEPDGTYGGLRAGLSIPLWKDKNKVKLAQSRYLYRQSVSSATEKEILNYVEKKYYEAEEYKNILKEFEETLVGTSDLKFIDQAFNAGQISIIDYILELSIFYEITDMMLKTEKGYYMALTELYSYKL